MKWEVRKECIKLGTKKFQNAIEVVAHLRAKANKYDVVHPKVKQHINKFLYKMKVGELTLGLFNIEGELIEAPSTFFVIQKSNPPNIIMSYFCVSCIDGSLESERVNKDHVHE